MLGFRRLGIFVREVSEKMSENAVPTRLHRALADKRRVQILDALRKSPDGLDAHALAGLLGVHANTVRWHLAILTDAGFIASRPGPRGKRGRPRTMYTLVEGPKTREQENYRLLATILTGLLSRVDNSVLQAVDAGRGWGRYLVRTPPPHLRLSDADAVQAVVDLLAEHGFCPETGCDEIRMRACPFHDLARTHPGVVCGVHRGLISGALAELGTELEVERLDPFVEHDLCIARLGRAAA
jgi:predicted ArsR family transcriptional regulator